MNIFTIGHSTHSIDYFLELLHRNKIEVLADVRAFPASRKFPQFNQSNLKQSLQNNGIKYEYVPLLAGRRNKSKNFQQVLNSGWDNQSFHNYADYTLTTDFQKGINQLKEIAKQNTTAYCCSERHPSRCHRLLISNWLAVQGWTVCHIIPQNKNGELVKHELGQWGAIPVIEKDNTVVYPRI